MTVGRKVEIQIKDAADFVLLQEGCGASTTLAGLLARA